MIRVKIKINKVNGTKKKSRTLGLNPVEEKASWLTKGWGRLAMESFIREGRRPDWY